MDRRHVLSEDKRSADQLSYVEEDGQESLKVGVIKATWSWPFICNSLTVSWSKEILNPLIAVSNALHWMILSDWKLSNQRAASCVIVSDYWWDFASSVRGSQEQLSHFTVVVNELMALVSKRCQCPKALMYSKRNFFSIQFWNLGHAMFELFHHYQTLYDRANVICMLCKMVTGVSSWLVSLMPGIGHLLLSSLLHCFHNYQATRFCWNPTAIKEPAQLVTILLLSNRTVRRDSSNDYRALGWSSKDSWFKS